MPTGMPICLKCPKCKRGKHGHRVRGLGCTVMPDSPSKERWRATRRGRVMRTLRIATCRDCGHTWWTTLTDGWLPGVGR